jgi:hypothetical protein
MPKRKQRPDPVPDDDEEVDWTLRKIFSQLDPSKSLVNWLQQQVLKQYSKKPEPNQKQPNPFQTLLREVGLKKNLAVCNFPSLTLIRWAN